MKKYKVVADSSCLIGLSQVEKLELLKELFLGTKAGIPVFSNPG